MEARVRPQRPQRGYAKLERSREERSAWDETEKRNPEGKAGKRGGPCTEDVIAVEGTMTKARQTRGSLLLRVALALLSLAVFYWGLHYKLSLYDAASGLQQVAPAKLWTGERGLGVTKTALPGVPADLLPTELTWPAALLFAPILLPLPASGREFHRTADWHGDRKRQSLSPHSAFFCFRPPPASI